MKLSLLASLSLHLMALAVLWWLWPTKGAPAAVRVSIHTVAAPHTNVPGTVSRVAEAPSATATPPEVVVASEKTEDPPPAPSAESQREATPGSSEPIIDALTSGPVVEKPSLLGYPSPGYPQEARRRGWEGVVEIEVEVSASGTWTSARVLRSSGHDVLDAAALEALRQARYEPATRNGVAEAGSINAVVRFRLD